MSPTAQDPLAELSHDHGHLGALVRAVRSALVGVEQAKLSYQEGVDQLNEAVELLRDALLTHFSREEEGFFPFVESHLPPLLPRVEALRADHDAVCQRVDELSRTVHQGLRDGAGIAACMSSFERFEAIYATHALLEISFLKDVSARVDADAREQLRTILAAI